MFEGLLAKAAGLGVSALANWQTLALKAAVVIAILAGTFFAGYRMATKDAVGNVAAAQLKHDQVMHKAATHEDTVVVARHAGGDQKAAVAVKIIHDKVYVTVKPLDDPHACDLSPDVIKALNDAGHQ